MIEENKTPRALVSSEDLEYAFQRNEEIYLFVLSFGNFFQVAYRRLRDLGAFGNCWNRVQIVQIGRLGPIEIASLNETGVYIFGQGVSGTLELIFLYY